MKKIKIVDASTLVPGPFASFLLMKHLDCDVLKIEDIHQPDPLINMRPTKDGTGLGYQSINQKKRIVKVDLRNNGLETLKREIKDANVFLENFKAGRTFKLGISYQDLTKINPSLIYCSISGFGSKTPLAHKSAHDLNILALSGYLDQQYKLAAAISLPPLLLADTFTTYHSGLRILSILVKNDLPAHLEISMYEAFLEAMTLNNYPQLISQKDFSAADFIMSGKFPCYGVYSTKDGGKVAVAAIEKPLWIDFCSHINRQDLVEKQFEIETTQAIAQEMKKYDREHWLADDIDFCVTPVLSINEAKNYKYV
ncbi:MAG: hypothetical protein US50_C0070G0006 [Candidatus Nomurabacteria bacterium GW2011_GWB1_37_5]|uniref:Uncharacterized protein n=1 Tax=Candidatus Nomurabacteria bacterium GW2011_GWB1_37_5 TaxID=1618742 RepID=A0A0G0GRY8_9BACT|nr:MAG: hypothetical protein US50_C0070G0006 [Candidatus Nomurabacteria bacterium GW2011_GWB1_37_5]